MVHTMAKRPNELFLSIKADDLLHVVTSPILEKRSRSPAPCGKNSAAERKRLVKKKSSKEKDQLLREQVLDMRNDYPTCDCLSPNIKQSSSTKSLKNRLINKPFTCAKLFDAVLDDDFSLVRECIIDDEMDVNQYSPEGTTVLHLASAAGYMECLELLLECGANINCKDINGRMALEYAVLYGNFDCAALLIENGADSKCINNGFH